jgi:hypothetical protein
MRSVNSARETLQCVALSPPTVTIRLLKGAPAEMRELQRVLEEAPVYAHRMVFQKRLPGTP